jgi:two-component system cell cycle response regulator DivK
MEQKTVLYIEDNFHNRRIVRKILQSQGYSLIEAEDGISGLAMVQELEPPLVLLDIGLPGMDGLEVVGRIKADERLREIPVIALTASAMRGDRERFLAAGCDDYLSKPIQAMELINMVKAYYPSNGKRP